MNILTDLGLSTCDKISVVKSAMSKTEPLCEERDCHRYQYQHLPGARIPGGVTQTITSITSTTSTTSVTSTCLVVMLDRLQEGVQGTMRKLCEGRKKCVALLVISQEENIHQDPPAEELAAEQKFSLQVAWLVVKILPRGYMVRLACSGRSKVWLEYGENVAGTNVTVTVVSC